jgi:hypothetical protein
VTTTKDGKSIPSTKVVELVKFDENDHRYLERDTTTVMGEPDQIEESWKEISELLTEEKVDHILTGCQEAGGFDTFVWVPAGLYTACVMPVREDDIQPYSGKIWIARVPFGLARAELHGPNGDTVTTLHSSSRL